MASRGWQVGPVLKDKPGSQGTLFRGGSAFSSDRRFPRGYTPERQSAVRDAVIMHGSFDNPETRPAAHRRMSDTIARSTVPTEHLSNVQFGNPGPGEHLVTDDKAAGIYMAPSGRREHGVIFVKPEYQRDSTVIHEVGHHVSHSTGTEHSQKYSYTEEHGGREEAFADNYATEHFRSRKGQQVERPIYGGGQFAGRIDRSESFWSGYGKARDWSLGRTEIEKADREYFRKNPGEEVFPDNTMDEPLVHHYGDGVLGLNHDAYPGFRV